MYLSIKKIYNHFSILRLLFFRNAIENAKIIFKEKCYRAHKWMLENLGDIDLLNEIGVLSSCHEIKKCDCYRHLLKWCLKILINRWDEIRYINFFDAIKDIKQNRAFFKNDFLKKYWEENEEKVQSIIRFYKLTDKPLEAIYENKEHFDILIITFGS